MEISRRAFTIVELLVVLFILTILIALVVGVGKYVYDEACRKNTASTQALILDAIQAYYDNGTPSDYPTDHYSGQPTPSEANSGILLMWLVGRPNYVLGDPDPDYDATDHPAVQAARERLRSLPEDAYRDVAFLDGYENEMRYEQAGGLGGTPVIISPGQDGDFDTPEDNIRSDGR